MKNILPFTLLLSLLLFYSLNTAAQEQRFSISGTVFDSATNQPLMGVYVTTSSKGAQTDRNGHFTIKNVEKGEYLLKTMYSMDYEKAEVPVNVNGNISDLKIYIKQTDLLLDQVVVTGTRTEKRLADVPVLTTVISSQSVEKAGSTSLTEALQDNIPGIVFSQNAMGNNMRIRGLNTRYVLFLVDGERMVSEGAGGNINLDQIDVNSIKRIEVINGAASALYGSNAVGAVINIITKDPVHKIEAGANASFESNNTWKMRVDVGSSTEKFSAKAGAFRNSSDGFDISGGSYAAKYEDYGGDLKLGYKPTERIDLNVTGRYFRHETFNPKNSMNVTHPLTHTMAVGFNGGHISADQKNSLRLSVHYDKYFDYDVFERLNDKAEKDNTASYTSARLIDTYKASEKWEFVGGAEFNYEEIYATTTLGPVPTTKDINDVNGFLQAQLTPIRRFDIVAGARYTHNSQFGSAFSPKLSLMYDIAGFKFRGGVGSAFRAPSIKELYYDFDHQGSFWVYGNPDLEPEKGIYTSTSVEYTKGAFNASVAAYYNDIDNKITQYDVINASGKNEKFYKNVSSATLKGFDVNATYTFFRQVTLRGSYSFCDAKDNSTGLQLSSNTKHSGTASATWNGKIARSPFSLQIAGRFHSPKIYQSVSTDAAGNEIVTEENSKSYSIWKATLVKPFRLSKHTFELTLKVDNIFDFKDASFVNPGCQYLIGLRYKFK